MILVGPHRSIFFLLGLIFLLGFTSSFNQSFAQEFLVQNYDENNLPSLEVTGACQDSSGAMWFSTWSGMVRYDGKSWEVFDPDPTNRSKNYRHVLNDRHGRVWALGLGTPFHLSVFDGRQWRSFPCPDSQHWGWDVLSFDMAEQPDGSVFLAMTSDRAFFFWDGEKWHFFNQADELEDIRSLAFLGDKLFLATAKGLLEFDSAKLELIHRAPLGMEQGPIQALAPTSNDQDGLWLVGTDWIGQYQDGHFRPLAKGLTLDFSKLETGTVAMSGPRGGLFFGGKEEFYFFHPQRGLRTMGKANGLANKNVSGFYLDREGNIWITTSRGISKLVSMRLESFDSGSGHSDDEVTAIIERPDGSMVLGHDGSLTILKPEPVLVVVDRDLPGVGRVMDMAYDSEGQLWIGFDQWGLAQLHDDNTLEWMDPDTGLPGYVFALHFDDDGTMWVGGSDGLYRRNGDSFEKTTFLESKPSRLAFIRRLDGGHDGSLLISTGMYGVIRMHEGKFEQWVNEDISLTLSCYQVFDLGSGDYWVATRAGLCRVNEGSLELTTEPDPVIHRPIYSILKDREGCFWFGTDSGFKIWDGEKLTTLNVQDGVLGRESNRDALFQASDGRVWMGTDMGLTIYDQLYDQPRTAPPMVTIGSPLVDGVEMDFKNQIELNPDHFELVIPFNGVSFLDESDIQYRTWLEGFEPQWQPYQNYPAGRIRYTNLPPGDYTFQVQARNPVGIQSEIIRSQMIRVKKPLNQIWWFIGLEILGILTLLTGVVYLVLGRLYRLRLEENFRQRTLELRVTEQAMRAESLRLFAVLASISDGVLAVDQNLKIVLSNPEAQALLDLRLDQLVGQKLEEVFVVDPPLVVKGRLLTDDVGQVEGAPIPVHQFENKEGQPCSLEISLNSLSLGDAELPGWVIAFRDITHRQLMEKEMIRNEQLESLGVLAGGIAHDFNNLLTIMLGNLSLVEKASVIGEEEKTRLERMKMATMRARGLAEQLLTFAKGDDKELQAVNLSELVQRCTDFVLSGSHVTSRMDVQDDLWFVEGDSGQLGQVVNNLVINAMQSMASGGRMELRLRNQTGVPGLPDTKDYVCLEIWDQGRGIAPENLGKIFNPYFTTKGTGSGLGLTIVHSIVMQHGGRILVDSKPGKGSHFNILLPAAVTPVQPKIKHPVLPPISAGLRVLVLDDEKEVLLLVEQMLTRLGLHCEGVADGDSAVEAFALALGRNRPFSVFIADLSIPGGVGGVEAFRKIKSLDDSVRGIVISGYSNDAVMANFQDYGFGAAVRKPFGHEQLAEGLATVLGEGHIRKN